VDLICDLLNKGGNLAKFTGLSIRGEDMAEQLEPLLISLHLIQEGVILQIEWIINLDVLIRHFTTAILLSHCRCTDYVQISPLILVLV